MNSKILLIEDDKVLNRLMSEHLRSMGHRIYTAFDWQQAQGVLEAHEPKLIIMDVQLPDARGMEILPRLVRTYSVIVLTAYGSVKDAVSAMKAGAAEYLVKPISLEELELVAQRTLENLALKEDHQYCKQRLEAKAGRRQMVGESPALNKLNELIDAVASSEVNVLIQGESGVGKELVARAVHDRSARAKRNYVALDCCTLQEKLFESELFGHERGSFTGAHRQKKGLIEAAEGGTLFLDEIGEIEPSIQAKLLRFLETGQFRRVGGTRDLHADVRVVAATNRDLESHSKEGRFRPDLFYRLAAFVIEVPPLRERREDIPLLARFFVEHHGFSRRVSKVISKAAMQQIVAYDWPGNIRELRNVIERAIILSRGKTHITPEHLAFKGSSSSQVPDLTLAFEREPTLEEVEKTYLSALLKRHQGHRSSVARTLGISERNVYRLIRKYDLKKIG